MNDEPFDARGPGNHVAAPQAFYAQIYPVIREVARAHGYALALHGTLQRDLDVVAVPWVEAAGNPALMAKAMADRLGAVLGEMTRRPHRRLSFAIILREWPPIERGEALEHMPAAGYIDLSIIEPDPTE